MKLLLSVQRVRCLGHTGFAMESTFWCMLAMVVCMHRVSIVAKEGIPCLVRVLGSVEDQDTSAADALSSTLSALLPSCDSLGGRVRFSLIALIYASGSWSGLLVAWGVRAVWVAIISLTLTTPGERLQNGLNGVL